MGCTQEEYERNEQWFIDQINRRSDIELQKRIDEADFILSENGVNRSHRIAKRKLEPKKKFQLGSYKR